jgi:hypothetical protein
LVVALLSVPALAADPGIERTVLAEVPYVAVTTWVNELLHVGAYLVLCNDYSYPYHYGAAVLMAERWTAPNRSLSSYRLCLEGSRSCLQVELLKRQ